VYSYLCTHVFVYSYISIYVCMSIYICKYVHMYISSGIAAKKEQWRENNPDVEEGAEVPEEGIIAIYRYLV